MGRFEALLSDYPLAELERSESVAFGAWPDLRLAWFNQAWFRFAETNGGVAIATDWPVGRSLTDAVPRPLEAFLRAGYDRARTEGNPWSYDYECSSPDVRREFRQTVYPLAHGEGFLAVNSLLVSGPHDGTRAPRGAVRKAEYMHEGNGLRQCAHCRRFLHVEVPRWDWIPRWIAEPPESPHQSLCPPCLGHFYPVPGQPRGR